MGGWQARGGGEPPISFDWNVLSTRVAAAARDGADCCQPLGCQPAGPHGALSVCCDDSFGSY